jgi:hypothetical protein
MIKKKFMLKRITKKEIVVKDALGERALTLLPC